MWSSRTDTLKDSHSETHTQTQARPCIKAIRHSISRNHNAHPHNSMHHAAVPRRAPGTERPSWHWHRFSLDSRACSHYQMTCGVPPESPRRRHLTGHAPCLVRAYVPGDPFVPVPVSLLVRRLNVPAPQRLLAPACVFGNADAVATGPIGDCP